MITGYVAKAKPQKDGKTKNLASPFSLQKFCLLISASLGISLVLVFSGLLGKQWSARAAVYCVNPSGTGGCYPTIQGAVDAAGDGDQINLAVGKYHENVIVGARRLTFNGAGEAKTILDGRQLGRVLTSEADMLLSNLTIQNGKTTGNGGGLSAEGAVTLTHVTVISNTSSSGSGGGIYATGMVSAVGGRFENNACAATTCRGGGVYAEAGLNLMDTQLLGNTATFRGGGAYTNGNAEISGGRFESNTCTRSDGMGGGLRANGALTLTDALFLDNAAGCNSNTGGGGASVGLSAWVSGGRFENNRCTETNGQGGGLRVNGISLSVSGTQFIGNTTPGDGGAVYFLSAGNVRVVNTLFAGNQAGGNGAALYLFNGSNGAAEILHTTITNPTPGSGAALYTGLLSGTLDITNTIFANYTLSIAAAASPEAVVHSDYNLFYNAPTSIATGSHSITGLNPGFVNPTGGNYHLQQSSPAVDKGKYLGVAIDLEGFPRLQAPAPDMGAYEYHYPRLFLPAILHP